MNQISCCIKYLSSNWKLWTGLDCWYYPGRKTFSQVQRKLQSMRGWSVTFHLYILICKKGEDDTMEYYAQSTMLKLDRDWVNLHVTHFQVFPLRFFCRASQFRRNFENWLGHCECIQHSWAPGPNLEALVFTIFWYIIWMNLTEIKHISKK